MGTVLPGFSHVVVNMDLNKKPCGCSIIDICHFHLNALRDNSIIVIDGEGNITTRKKMERKNYKLDTNDAVFIYENEFYPLSNFSAFRLNWRGLDFDTSEHAYHWEKFYRDRAPWDDRERLIISDIQHSILKARSAHDAFKIAQRSREHYRYNWENDKTLVMTDILLCKVAQHEYVYKKLMETGSRKIVEDSWRDNYWGAGEDGSGQNMLGQLWMNVRERIRKNEGSSKI
jgi:ribA/ribD-fused uncharacterized protein